MVIYSSMDTYGRATSLYPDHGGILVIANPRGAFIPDDEIPRLIGKLQDYMSRRANELAKGAKR